jgi:hypothetical protein
MFVLPNNKGSHTLNRYWNLKMIYILSNSSYLCCMRIILTICSFLIAFHSLAQRCGGGVFSFEIINPDQEEITFTVYPFDGSYTQEFKENACHGGCQLDRKTAEKWRSILHLQRQNDTENLLFPLYGEHRVKKNRVEFNTLELATEFRVVLFKSKDSNKEIFIAANLHGGCDHTRKINWGEEQPRLLQYGE